MKARLLAVVCVVACALAGCSGDSGKSPSGSAGSSGKSKAVFPDRSKSKAASMQSSLRNGKPVVRAEVGKQIQPGRYEIRASGLTGDADCAIQQVSGKVTARSLLRQTIDLPQIQARQGHLFTADLAPGEAVEISAFGKSGFSVSFTPAATKFAYSPTGAGTWVAGLDIPTGKFRLTGIRNSIRVWVFDAEGRMKLCQYTDPLFDKEALGKITPLIRLNKGDVLVYFASSFSGSAAGDGSIILQSSVDAQMEREWKDTAPDKATGQPITIETRFEDYIVGKDIPAGYYRIESATNESIVNFKVHINGENLDSLGFASSITQNKTDELNKSNIMIIHVVERQKLHIYATGKDGKKYNGIDLTNPFRFRFIPIDKFNVNVKAMPPGIYAVGRDIPPGVYEYAGGDKHLKVLEVASPEGQYISYSSGLRSKETKPHRVTLSKGQMVFISSDGLVNLRKKG